MMDHPRNVTNGKSYSVKFCIDRTYISWPQFLGFWRFCLNFPADVHFYEFVGIFFQIIFHSVLFLKKVVLGPKHVAL